MTGGHSTPRSGACGRTVAGEATDDFRTSRSPQAGATLETGVETVELDGVEDSLVVAPTVLSDIDEAVELANDTEYGLSGSVHAGDVGTGEEMAERVETGMITATTSR